MALVHPTSLPVARPAPGRHEHPRSAAVVPLEQRRDAPAEPADEGSRLERARVQLLVERARAARERRP